MCSAVHCSAGEWSDLTGETGVLHLGQEQKIHQTGGQGARSRLGDGGWEGGNILTIVSVKSILGDRGYEGGDILTIVIVRRRLG